jgi:hypothetical protein
MLPFEMLRLVNIVRTDFVYLRSERWLLVTATVVPSSPYFSYPDDGGTNFLRNVGS